MTAQRFLLYQLYSQAALKHKYINGKGDIIVHISSTALGNIIISLPDENNQTDAVKKIDRTIEETKNVTAILNREIEILKEYKTRLISDVVTGKIDVRDVKIPDYDYVEEDTENNVTEEFDEVDEDGGMTDN